MPVPLFAELSRRRVFRAVVGYGVVAFAVLQIVEPIMHGLQWPEPVLSYVVVALAAGFPVVVGLAWIFDVNAGRIERTPPAPSLRGPRLIPLLLGLGVLTAAPGLLYYFVLRPPRAAAPSAGAGPGVEASIAVLPLVNMSRDPDQDYFADGLAEELLDLLAKVPGLHVAARTSAFSFKGKNEDVRTIAEKLNVATLLEGSVRKAGDQVRITTQLINAKDGYHLWSETYDRKLTDVFAVQDEIAQAVVAALKLKLLPGQEPNSKLHRTGNPEVYAQYLLGKQFFNSATLDGFKRAAQAFDKALAMEPGFAPAWAGLAHATYWIADSADSVKEIADGQARALVEAEQAVALAPDLAEAYVARGAIRCTRWDWKGGKEDFQRALALSPENPETLRDYSFFVLRPAGRLQEAVAVSRKAVSLDPLNGRAWASLAGAFVQLGAYREAQAAAERSLEVNPEQAFAAGWLGIALVLDGKPAEALPVFARSTSPVFRLAGIATAQYALGHGEEARRAADELIAKHGHDAAYQIAGYFAFSGDKDRAFEWLNRAFAQGDGGLALVKVDPLLRNLRGDPRYPPLLKKLNFD